MSDQKSFSDRITQVTATLSSENDFLRLADACDELLDAALISRHSRDTIALRETGLVIGLKRIIEAGCDVVRQTGLRHSQGYNSLVGEPNSFVVDMLTQKVIIPKNTAYGSAYERFGIVGILIRMGDKSHRIKSLCANTSIADLGESAADTCVDLICYAILALLVFEDNKEKEALNAMGIVKSAP